MKLLTNFFTRSNEEGNTYFSPSLSDVIATLTSIISNYDLTEMFELSILLLTELVPVTKAVASIKALVLPFFSSLGFPIDVRSKTVPETMLAIILVTDKKENCGKRFS